jgi:hypothetical protein
MPIWKEDRVSSYKQEKPDELGSLSSSELSRKAEHRSQSQW